MQAIRYVKNN